jgi:hypothetical protein
MPRSGTFFRVAALSILLLGPACTAQDKDGGYRVVSMTVTYDAQDRRAREWDALMKALDECHGGGFADAQPAAAPETRCVENGPDGCARTQAHLSWDCIGMGYQPN